jgi:hypothetical protein
VKAKVLCDAGKIKDGEAVEIVTKAEASEASKRRSAGERLNARQEPRDLRASKASLKEYKVRDDAGHEESVDTRDLQLLR